MNTLIIDLKAKDIDNIGCILTEIAKSIDDGFTSGVEFPVNWQLKAEGTVTMEFMANTK